MFHLFYRDYGYSGPVAGGGGGGGWYSGFQVTGKERGKNEKRKESLGLPPEPNQIALPKTNPQKSYDKFLASH